MKVDFGLMAHFSSFRPPVVNEGPGGDAPLFDAGLHILAETPAGNLSGRALLREVGRREVRNILPKS